jgi:glucokinase
VKPLLEVSEIKNAAQFSTFGAILVGDVGGTNARFAVYRYPLDQPANGEVVYREVREVADYRDFGSAMDAYLRARELSPAELDGACLAVASAVVGDEISFTNSPWRFSIRDLAEQFGFKRLKVVNDFEALGLSVGGLPEKSSLTVQAGEGARIGTEVVLGPGTGLGIAVRHCSSGIILPSEGGHISFAPTDQDERELLDYISCEFPRVSYERILSGAGLARLYAFQCGRRGVSLSVEFPVAAAEVVRRATHAHDQVAEWAIDRFLRILGHFAGDSVLMFGGFRGVYLAGGILPRISSRLLSGGFLERFTDKGRFSTLMRNTPIRLITDDTASLRGAAFHLIETN